MEINNNIHIFEQRIEEFITASKYNIKLSGVAFVFDNTNLHYSASFIVDGEGPIPDVARLNVAQTQAAFQRFQPCEFTFHKLQGLNFIMKTPEGEIPGKRWQVIYTFRQ